MHDDDWVYYAARADQEDEAARKASRPEAAHIHRILANRYRTKASERKLASGNSDEFATERYGFPPMQVVFIKARDLHKFHRVDDR